MAETVSPEATVWDPPVAAVVAAGAVPPEVGIVRLWPSRMKALPFSPFALRTADTVVPYFAAMWLTVSPERTVYDSSACAAGAVAVAATATIASAPVLVARSRPRRAAAPAGAPGVRAAWSVRARAGCDMVGTPGAETSWCGGGTRSERVTRVTRVTEVTSATVVHVLGPGKSTAPFGALTRTFRTHSSHPRAAPLGRQGARGAARGWRVGVGRAARPRRAGGARGARATGARQYAGPRDCAEPR